MKQLITAVSLCAVAACGSDNKQTDGNGGNGNDVLSGNLAAVVTSDYQSTGVALLNLDTQTVVSPTCITSGTQLGTISATLSADVVLPSQPQANHELVLIDRTNLAITYVDPNTCKPRIQVSIGKGYDVDPHDVASISPMKSYVTRYGVNPSPTGEEDRGNDVAVINPQNGNVTGYIDLTSYSANAVLSMPDRIWVVDSNAYVSLSEASSDFSQYGTARVVVIDTNTDSVIGTFDITGKEYCSQMAGDANGLSIACGGNGFTKSPAASTTGVAFISATGDTVSQNSINYDMVSQRYINANMVASLGSGLYLTASEGDFKTTADGLWLYDISSPTAATHIADSEVGSGFGTMYFRASSQTVFVTDGDSKSPRIRTFKLANGALTEGTAISVGADTGLPPRAISPL